MVNKKAWVKIVEAFFAIMLIAGVLVFVITTYYTPEDHSREIYLFEEGVLDGVKLDSILRTEVLSSDGPSASPILNNYLQIQKESTAPYLDCSFVICSAGSVCTLDENVDGELFGKSIVLSAEGEHTEPKVLSLFCWVK